MTENVKIRRLFLSVALIVALALSLSLNSFAPLKANASAYYDANKEKVEAIDAGAVNFKKLDDLAEEDDMTAMVAVATAINEFIASYDEKDYFSSDWADITKQFDLCKNYFKTSDSATDGSNYYLNYSSFTEGDAYASRIAGYRAVVDGFLTKSEKYDAYKLDDVNYLSDKKTEMLKTNAINDGVAPNQVVGIYDDTAIEELEAIVTEGQAALNECEAIVEDGSIDYKSSCGELDEVKAEYVKKLLDVKKNDAERAIAAINDYKAILSGAKDGDKDAAKEAAEAAVEKGKEFLDGASPEVKNYYKQALTDMNVFEEGGEPEDLSDLDDAPTLKSEDGVVTVTAFVNGAEVNVFPHNASVKINDNTGSVYSLNLDNAIAKDDRNISVAYCMDIDIYEGATLWEQKTEYEGGEITYVVKVDLAKYFSERVEN